MQAEIISIGNELLNGRTVNTNASFIASKLVEIGIHTRRIQSIGDDAGMIQEALQQSINSADVILITGGLGPTHDDITKKVLVDFFDSELIFDKHILADIKTRFEKRGLEMPEINRVMAYVPKNAEMIPNPIGTAKGMLFSPDDKLIFVLPGIPQEMKAMVDNSVIPLLKEKCDNCQIQVDTFRTTGIPESAILDKIIAELSIYSSYEIAFLPHYTGVDIRITRKNDDILNQKKFSSFKRLLLTKIGNYIYTTKKEDLETVVGNLLRKRNLNISVAESITGGLIQDKITNVAGSSVYFFGGVVTYSNESKIKILGISKDSLDNYGAVSEIVAKEMAVNVRNKFSTDIGLSTTGIAGPTGSTPTKPLGLVYIGLASSHRVEVQKIQFGNNRFFNKQRSAQAALEIVRRHILGIGL